MQNHLLQDHFACVFHSQSHHRKTVSDQDHVHAGSIGYMRAWKIMCCDHGNRFLFLMKIAESIESNLFPG
jgi:hypothetical protein